MIKYWIKLAALAGLALCIGNCSKQNPISTMSGDSHSIAEAGNMAPSEFETIANLKAGNGQLFFITKASNGQVYYKLGSAGNWPSGWTNTGYFASSNIVTLNCGTNSWVIFRATNNNLITLSNLNNSGSLSYIDYFSKHPTYVSWTTNGQLAAAPFTHPKGIVPMIFGRQSNNTLYCSLPPGLVSAPKQLSTTAVGNNIAANTLTSPYGTTGLIEAFTTDNSGNLLALTQTSFYSSSNPYGGWQSSYTNLGNLAGSAIYNNVAIGKDAAGYLEAFTISANDGFIYHLYQTSSTAWTPWSQINNPTKIGFNKVSVGTNADGRLELFFIAFDYTYYDDWCMFHQWQSAPNSPWSLPTILTGTNGLGIMMIEGQPWCEGSSGGATPEEYVFTTKTMYPTDSVSYINQLPTMNGWNSWATFY
jgi:hypothetical protein